MNTLRELGNLSEPKKYAGREVEKITLRETSQFASKHEILSVVKLERTRDWTCSTHVETTYTPIQSEEIEYIYGASTHRKD
jgi:hypothetical protein